MPDRGWEWRTQKRRRVVTRRIRYYYDRHGQTRVPYDELSLRAWFYLLGTYGYYRKDEHRAPTRRRDRYSYYDSYYHRAAFRALTRQECLDSELFYHHFVIL